MRLYMCIFHKVRVFLIETEGSLQRGNDSAWEQLGWIGEGFPLFPLYYVFVEKINKMVTHLLYIIMFNVIIIYFNCVLFMLGLSITDVTTFTFHHKKTRRLSRSTLSEN